MNVDGHFIVPMPTRLYYHVTGLQANSCYILKLPMGKCILVANYPVTQKLALKQIMCKIIHSMLFFVLLLHTSTLMY